MSALGGAFLGDVPIIRTVRLDIVLEVITFSSSESDAGATSCKRKVNLRISTLTRELLRKFAVTAI